MTGTVRRRPCSYINADEQEMWIGRTGQQDSLQIECGNLCGRHIPQLPDLQGRAGPTRRESSDVCPICLQPMQEAPARSWPGCQHWFHEECIEQVLTGHRARCPLCRRGPDGSQPPPWAEADPRTDNHSGSGASYSSEPWPPTPPGSNRPEDNGSEQM
eukprot:5181289-Prorocentrum_lima.AAC.1